MAGCNKLGARVRQVSNPLSLIIADEYLLQGHTMSWHFLLELVCLSASVAMFFPGDVLPGLLHPSWPLLPMMDGCMVTLHSAICGGPTLKAQPE
jgi:hypothetical protein